MNEDKTLSCQDCGADFVFTTRDQEFFQEKGFAEPKRCRKCAKSRRRSLRQDTEVKCHACGEPTTVPFKPTMDEETGEPVKPVFCRPCFDARQGNEGGAPAAADSEPAQEAA
jgi:CxxC-x17-CxxC domain-containing protein